MEQDAVGLLEHQCWERKLGGHLEPHDQTWVLTVPLVVV